MGVFVWAELKFQQASNGSLIFHLSALFCSCWSANGLRCNERLRDSGSFCGCRFWFSFLCCSHFAHESINSIEISFNLQVVDTKARKGAVMAFWEAAGCVICIKHRWLEGMKVTASASLHAFSGSDWCCDWSQTKNCTFEAHLKKAWK